jgi:AraC-like DNA-binding protein
MITVIRGSGVVILPDGTELKAAAGTTVLVLGPEPFQLADSAATIALPLKARHLTCSTHDIEDKSQPVLSSGGDEPDGSTTLVVGTYRATRSRHDRLLRTLPPALVLEEDIGGVLWLNSLRDAVSRRQVPGGQALIDRILDWGLVCTLGCWFDQQGSDAPAWYRGTLDPVAGPALEAIHQRPAEPWTVGSLAAEASVSRAHFAKRFTEIMGQPPLSYLSEWRIYRAEELLTDSDLSIANVAKAVGYNDPFAFSTAFKRKRGTSPRDFRTSGADVRVQAAKPIDADAKH